MKAGGAELTNDWRGRLPRRVFLQGALACLGGLIAARARAAGVSESALATAVPDEVLDRLVRRAAARGDRTLDILLLSGGGQNGAYGVGFLRGWKSRADEAMPTFDVVTGISTGSLMAPFALLGDEADLDAVARLYRNAADQIMPSLDPFILIRPTGGLVNRSKFERTVERIVDEPLAARLRAEFAADRQMFVGTTDLDRGIGRVWDIGHELGASPAGLARYRRILIAAAAIPGAFPPLSIDGHTHVDGGVATNMLLGANLGDFERLGEGLSAAGTGPLRIRLWVIVNLWIRAVVVPVKATRVGAIRKRSNALLFMLRQQQTLTRLWELSRAVTTGVPGLAMEVRYTAVPDGFAYEPGAKKLFDRDFMERLEHAGFERARSSAPWGRLPPDPFETLDATGTTTRR